MDSLAQALYRHIDQLRHCKRVWLAYSGGVDSHALLAACSALLSETETPTLCAVHIHHGLMPDAEQWSLHCEATAQALGVTFRLIRVNAEDTDGLGPERAAREARYQAFRELMQAGDCLLTAHHQDDQAETVLLQLFRGAGIDGLSAMPEVSAFGEGYHLRPFLGISRESIVNYARSAQLNWIEDHSNQDQDLDRNYVRHTLVPLIQERWPAFSSNTARSARLCGETSEWLHDYATERIKAQPLTRMDLGILTQESHFVRRLMMREWLRRAGVRMPSYKVMEQILHQFVGAKADAEPRCRLQQQELRRYRNQVFLLPVLPKLEWYEVHWHGDSCPLPGGLGSLKAETIPGKGIAVRFWRDSDMVVRPRLGGERIRLAGRAHHTSLKHWFQEQNIPPWIREHIPLIYRHDELLAIGDLWVDAALAASDDEPGICIHWHSPYGSGADNQT